MDVEPIAVLACAAVIYLPMPVAQVEVDSNSVPALVVVYYD